MKPEIDLVEHVSKFINNNFDLMFYYWNKIVNSELITVYLKLRIKSHIIFEMHLFAILTLHCCDGFYLILMSVGHSLVAVCELLIAMTSLVLQPRL